MATNIEKLIISHNKDAQNRKMVAFYDRKSTMEKMGIARSETAHSAFLANLLKSDNGLGLEESAIMWLLHILIEREDNATAYNSTSSKSPIPTDVKAAVLSQTLKYDIEEITTEKVIDDVAPSYFATHYNNQKCDDRLDIYIKLKVNGLSVKYLEIVIENKVLQDENGPKSKNSSGYDSLFQTQRYYTACSHKKPSDTAQLFVFLTPDEVEEETKAKDKHFIQISYQDVLDTIIIPQLDNNMLTSNERQELENYVDALNLPTLDIQAKKRIVMAMTEEARTDKQTYLKKNKELIINVIKAKEKEASNSSSLTEEEQIEASNSSSLTQDEKILVSFADKRKNLFAAHGMDFDTIKPTYYFVFITDGATYRIAHLCTADVAVNFAKLYYKYNSGSSIGQLNNDFANVKPNIFSVCNVQKNNTNSALYVKIANGVYFPKNIWSGKNIGDGKENYFSKLLTMINNTNNVSKDFKYEVIR